MDYIFKKFVNTGGKYENRITITATRSIGFPAKFYHENQIENFKFVVLYYDEAAKAIGIQFINDEKEQHKFTIVKSQAGYGGNIVATSFFKKFDLDPISYKGRYEWKKENTEFGPLYIIELTKK
jgi:hypothetical protein